MVEGGLDGFALAGAEGGEAEQGEEGLGGRLVSGSSGRGRAAWRSARAGAVGEAGSNSAGEGSGWLGGPWSARAEGSSGRIRTAPVRGAARRGGPCSARAGVVGGAGSNCAGEGSGWSRRSVFSSSRVCQRCAVVGRSCRLQRGPVAVGVVGRLDAFGGELREWGQRVALLRREVSPLRAQLGELAGGAVRVGEYGGEEGEGVVHVRAWRAWARTASGVWPASRTTKRSGSAAASSS